MTKKFDENVRVVDWITEKLTAAGHRDPRAWQEGIHPDALKQDTQQNVQRFLANRNLRLVLGKLPIDTLLTRSYLVDNGPMENWAQHMEQAVIPCLVENQ